MKPLIVRPEVAADLDCYWLHIARANVRAADDFLAAARLAEQRIAQLPALGRLRRWRDRRLAGIRSRPLARPFSAWLVFYRETSAAVEILRVLHGMMELERGLSEPPET